VKQSIKVNGSIEVIGDCAIIAGGQSDAEEAAGLLDQAIARARPI
jgi:hypothetical protein